MNKTQEKTRIAACRRILKSAKNYIALRLEFLQYANTVDSIQYVCGGYRIVAFKNPLPLEERPDNVSLTFNFEDTLQRKTHDAVILNIPDKKTLKAYIKEEKQKAKETKCKSVPKYDFGENLPMVNANYLLDMINIFPDGTFYADDLLTIFVEDHEGNRGKLLGLRKKDINAEATKL